MSPGKILIIGARAGERGEAINARVMLRGPMERWSSPAASGRGVQRTDCVALPYRMLCVVRPGGGFVNIFKITRETRAQSLLPAYSLLIIQSTQALDNTQDYLPKT